MLPNLFPLVDNSQAMKLFLRNIQDVARAKTFVAVTGSKGDFLEAGAVFARCAEAMGLDNPIFVRPEMIREDFALIAKRHTGALCIAAGGQIPSGAQEALADLDLPSYTKLILTLIHTRKDQSTSSLLRPNFYKRCGGMTLAWPEWQDRAEDHDKLIDHAQEAISRARGSDIKLSPDMLKHIRSTTWRSVGHMVRAMNQIIAHGTHAPASSRPLLTVADDI